MSDTDDTDTLLLIPPNFFLEQSSGSDDSLLESSRTVVHKPKSCTSHVIGKLVSQVHCLENRLECLELSTAAEYSSRESLGNRVLNSSLSFDSHSLDRKCFTFPTARKRKILPRRRLRQISITSQDSTSTCSKDIPPLPLDSKRGDKFDVKVPVKSINDLQSMDGDISSIVSTPSKRNDKLLLHEIDEFLHKVETYESPESNFKVPETSLSPENVIRATGDYIAQKLDSNNVSQVKKLNDLPEPSHILSKYIYLTQNDNMDKAENVSQNQYMNDPTSKPTSKTDYSLPSTSNEPKSPAYRRLQFTDINNKDVQPTSTPKKSTNEPFNKNLNRFRPSTNKVYDRASKVLEQYKTNYSRSIDDTVNTSLIMATNKEESKPTVRAYGNDDRSATELCRGAQKLIDTIDTDLLSLSDLWGLKTDKTESGKLEEERLKREV